MRKTFCVLMLLAAIAFSANAWAASTFVRDGGYGGSGLIATEILATAITVNLEDDDVGLVYTPDAALAFVEGDIITIQLSNGTFKDSLYYFTDAAGVQYAYQTALSSDAKTLTMKVNQGFDSTIPVYLSSTTGATTSPKISITGSLSAGSFVRAGLSATDEAYQIKPLAPATCTIFTTFQQFTYGTGRGESTIDISATPPRTLFDGAPWPIGGKSFTDAQSVATLQIVNNATGFTDDHYVVASTDTFTMVLTSSLGGFDTIKTAVIGCTAASGEIAVTSFTGVIDGDTITFSGKLANLLAMIPYRPYVVLTVDGDPLDVQTMASALTYNIVAAVGTKVSYAANTVSFTKAETFVWDMNGTVFKVPYLNADSANYGTYVVVTNTSATDRELVLDVTGSNGDTVTSVSLGMVGATKTRLYSPSQINAAIKAKDPSFLASNPKYEGTFLIALRLQQLTVYAYQNQGTTAAKRPVPVYNTTNWWGRR